MSIVIRKNTGPEAETFDKGFVSVPPYHIVLTLLLPAHIWPDSIQLVERWRMIATSHH